MIVTKFGGSSLANAEQFAKVKKILFSDADRLYAIPSAPGMRCANDPKVTDLMYQAHTEISRHLPDGQAFSLVCQRFTEIAQELHLNSERLLKELSAIRLNLENGFSREYAASRGEYLCGLLLSEYLGWNFIDAKDVVFFHADGTLDAEKTNEEMKARLLPFAPAVLPGFYGCDEEGNIRTFSRGGSDITGALAARAVNAEKYENWTDVTGFRMADPRIVPGAKYVSKLSYRELRELSYMGASVLHEDAVFPVHRAGIPTNIRNTNFPDHPGTLISSALTGEDTDCPITGIAGTRGFAILSIEKDGMNSELGFGRRVLQVLEDFQVSFEHLPTGIDAMSVVVEANKFLEHKNTILNEIQHAVHPDAVSVHEGIALIATVGRGMSRTPGVAARLFTALAAQGISLRIIDQGYGELSIIIGVDEDRFDDAVRAIYDTFIET